MITACGGVAHIGGAYTVYKVGHGLSGLNPKASIFSSSPPPTQVMSKHTDEELKVGGTLSVPSQEDGVSTFDDVEKRRIWRTLDVHLLPLVSLLFLMSFL